MDSVDQEIARAMGLRKQGDTAGTLESASALVDRFPSDHRPLRYRARLRASSGSHRQAVDDLTQAISIKPIDPGLFFIRGECLMHIGEDAAAANDFTRGLYLCDELNDTWYRDTLLFFRAEAYLRLGHKKAAREDLLQLPEDFTFWINQLRTRSEMLTECR